MYTFGFTVLPVWPTCSAYGTQPASTIARDAPNAPLSCLGELLDERLVVLGRTDAASTGHDDGRLFELRTLLLLHVALEHLRLGRATGVGRRDRVDRGRTATRRLGRERLRPDRDERRAVAA